MGFQNAINKATTSVMGGVAAISLTNKAKKDITTDEKVKNEKLKNIKLQNKNLRLDNRRLLALAKMKESSLAKMKQKEDLLKRYNELRGNINGSK